MDAVVDAPNTEPALLMLLCNPGLNDRAVLPGSARGVGTMTLTNTWLNCRRVVDSGGGAGAGTSGAMAANMVKSALDSVSMDLVEEIVDDDNMERETNCRRTSLEEFQSEPRGTWSRWRHPGRILRDVSPPVARTAIAVFR